MIRNTYISGFTSSGGGGFVFQNLQSVLSYGNTASSEMIFSDGEYLLDFLNADAGVNGFGLRFIGSDQAQISRIYFNPIGDTSPLLSMFDNDYALEFQLGTLGLTFFNYNYDPPRQLSLKAQSTNDYGNQLLFLPQDSGKLQTQKTPAIQTIDITTDGSYVINLTNLNYGYNYSWDLSSAFSAFNTFIIQINEKSAGMTPYCRYYLCLDFDTANTIYIVNDGGNTDGIFGITTITQRGLYMFMIDYENQIYITQQS
jgi:hypothetical protein